MFKSVPTNLKEQILADGGVNAFGYYIPKFNPRHKVFNSPLRNDRTPSFSVFESSTGIYLFKDMFTQECGNVIKLVQLLYNISYSQALIKIADDMGIINEDYRVIKIRKIIKLNKKQSNEVKLAIKVRDYEQKDINWWGKFSINIDTLKKYFVYPCEYIFVNDKPIFCRKLTYAYKEFKDSKITWKFYQPEGEYKWISNHKADIWQGWAQMPKSGDILILTKSLKDVMSITENTDYPAVAPQSEGTILKKQVVEELKTRFEKIYLLFDNDTAGKKFSKELSEKYEFHPIFIPQEFNSKDFSDLCKNHSVETACETLKSLLL